MNREYTLNELRKSRLGKSLLNIDTCFYALFNQAKDSIFIMDPASEEGPVIVEANEAACKDHGYTYEEIIGKPIAFLDDPEARKRVPERAERLMAGETLTFEAVHVRKDGSTFSVEVSAQIIHLEKKPYILAIDRDITRRKEAERLLTDKISELQVFYDVAVAREQKIKRLEKEIEHLRSELEKHQRK
jgi:PAS domain S-box-containing protein